MITGETGETAAAKVRRWADEVLGRWYPGVKVASAWDNENDRCILHIQAGENGEQEEVVLDAAALRTEGSEWRCARPLIAAAWTSRRHGSAKRSGSALDLQALGNVLAKVRGILETVHGAERPPGTGC